MAKYHRQLSIALERINQGLTHVHTFVKRGENQKALYYMDNDLKELYEELQNIINIEPGEPNSRIGNI
jgi:hypothetical protein